MNLGFRIPIISGIPDSIGCISDFKARFFQIPLGKHRDEQYFQDFEIWILFVWGDLLAAVVLQNVLRIIWEKMFGTEMT